MGNNNHSYMQYTHFCMIYFFFFTCSVATPWQGISQWAVKGTSKFEEMDSACEKIRRLLSACTTKPGTVARHGMCTARYTRMEAGWDFQFEYDWRGLANPIVNPSSWKDCLILHATRIYPMTPAFDFCSWAPKRWKPSSHPSNWSTQMYTLNVI